MGVVRRHLQIGPFTVDLTTNIAALDDELRAMYLPSTTAKGAEFIDFAVELWHGHGLRRWLRPQVMFKFDGHEPFKPLPLDQALPMFEWGLNQVIASMAIWYFIIHAAAIEKDGCVAIMPGSPGAGKSTLTAALVHRGWRLLSDELAVIRLVDFQVVPLARPINLKNASIGIMRRFVPSGVFSREARDTVKGTVALLRAPEESLARMAETAPPRWIVFPYWQGSGAAQFHPMSKGDAFMQTRRNSVNYDIHGANGFRLLTGLIDRCDCFRFTYHSLEDAIAAFETLAGGALTVQDGFTEAGTEPESRNSADSR